MTSGKASKRRRAARVPPPPVKGPGGTRRASPKVLIGAAVVVALIVLGIVLGFVFTGGSSSSSNTPARGSLTGGLPGAADAQRLFQGIPQHGNVLGSANAPVTLVEYIDLQCPYCQQFETQALPKLVAGYIRRGKVKLEARPIAFIGPDSERGRAAALAAAQQDRLFNFMELLYFNQATENTGWLSEAMVKAAAASIPGLDVHALLSARGSSAIRDEETQFDNQSKVDRVTETPTVLVGKTGGPLRKASVSLTDIKSLSTAIENARR